MKKSINTLLKHSSFSKINRSANPAVVRASTILFDSMQELASHEKKLKKINQLHTMPMEDTEAKPRSNLRKLLRN